MTRVVHFEIPVKDLEASKSFYSKVFGWKVTKWDGQPEYWMIETGKEDSPGINGGFYTPSGPLSGTVNTIDVDNLDEALSKVKANGGDIIVPKMPVPGVGWLAYAKDPGGAVFGLMQADPNSRM
jgi:predicted enzyme related to lactoylglutathione lyase